MPHSATRQRETYYENHDARKTYHREWLRERMKDPEFKAKRAEYARKWRANNPDKTRAQDKKKRDNRAHWLVQKSRERARKKGLEHTIVETDVVLPVNCPVLGIPLNYNAEVRGWDSPSLDRIDNNGGYTPGNVLVVSYKANTIKGAWTPDELQQVADFYRNIS